MLVHHLKACLCVDLDCGDIIRENVQAQLFELKICKCYLEYCDRRVKSDRLSVSLAVSYKDLTKLRLAVAKIIERQASDCASELLRLEYCEGHLIPVCKI